jgi:transcriptional regulator with GAF, ATPase, and Fis domain
MTDVRRLAAVSLPLISTLTRALAERDQPAATFRALDRLLAKLVGHRLFAALLYHPKAGMAERLYSSRPDVYPASGTKALEQAPAMKRVLTSGTPYLGQDAGDIERDFPDLDRIFALGCGSVLNMPVRWKGEVLGQINLLHEARHFGKAHLPMVEAMAQIVVPAILIAAEHAPGGWR